MPPGGAIRAGKAFVELFADNSKLVKGLKLAEAKIRAYGNQVSAIGKSLARVGTVAIAPLLGAAKVFSSMGDQVAKMAKRTGFSVEALSELRFVASQTGTEFETLENGLRRMQRTIHDAGRGLSTATDALTDLGIEFKDLDGLAPEEQFKKLADGLESIKDPTKKAAIAMSIFGRSGTNLLPMFAQGSKGINKLMAEARALGLTMSTEDAAAAEVFTDVLDKLWTVVKFGVFHVGSALAPTLQKLAKTLTDVATKSSEWVQANKQVIVIVAAVATVVLATGVALLTFASMANAVATTVGVAAKAIAGLPVVLKALKVALTFLVAHPAILAIVAITTVAVAAAVALGILRTRTAELNGEMRALREEGDRKRASDLDQIERLEELADKQSLSNSELQEARSITADLQGEYGDMGIIIDETTGSITGLVEAQNALNKAMKETALAQLNAEIAEMERNLSELDREARDTSASLLGTTGFADIDALTKKADEAAEVLIKLMDRRSDLLEGDEEAIVSGASATGGSSTVVDQKSEEVSRRIAQLAINQIEDVNKRAIARINERYDHEEKRAKEAGATKELLDKIELARALEIQAAYKKAKQEKLEFKALSESFDQPKGLFGALKGIAGGLGNVAEGLAGKFVDGVEGFADDLGLGNVAARDNAFDRLKEVAGGSGAQAQSAVEKSIGVSGTFNASALLGLQAGGAADRTARATEKTANGVEKLQKSFLDSRPVFT